MDFKSKDQILLIFCILLIFVLFIFTHGVFTDISSVAHFPYFAIVTQALMNTGLLSVYLNTSY